MGRGPCAAGAGARCAHTRDGYPQVVLELLLSDAGVLFFMPAPRARRPPRTRKAPRHRGHAQAARRHSTLLDRHRLRDTQLAAASLAHEADSRRPNRCVLGSRGLSSPSRRHPVWYPTNNNRPPARARAPMLVRRRRSVRLVALAASFSPLYIMYETVLVLWDSCTLDTRACRRRRVVDKDEDGLVRRDGDALPDDIDKRGQSGGWVGVGAGKGACARVRACVARGEGKTATRSSSSSSGSGSAQAIAAKCALSSPVRQ